MNEPMQMNCSEALNELPLFVGEDLESSARERIAEHLQGCAPCSETLVQFQESREARLDHFESTAAGAPSVSMWPALQAQLRAEGLLASGPSAKLQSDGTAHASPLVEPKPLGGRVLRFVPMAAAAAGIFFLGIMSQNYGVSPEPSQPSTSPNLVESSLPSPTAGSGATGLVAQPVALTPVPENAGSTLQLADPAGEILIQRAQPFLGDRVRSFNAFRQIGGGSNNAASFRSGASPANCDGIR